MKNLFTLFFICFTGLTISGQEFITGQWNVRITSDDNSQANKFVRYYFGSDTFVVGQNTYWPLLESHDDDGEGGILYGYFREDGDKIYKYVTENDDEYKFYDVTIGEKVYYDFGLKTGDVFKSYIGDYQVTVSEVDSLELDDGTFRKSIHLQCIDANWLDNSIWVEGIGDLNYGFEGVRLFCGAPEGDWFLTCYYEDSELQYQNPDSIDCFVLSINNSFLNDITISPNPAFDILNINGVSDDIDITILNQVGEVVKCERDSKNMLSIDNLAVGMYYISIQSKGDIIVKKFVKI